MNNRLTQFALLLLNVFGVVCFPDDTIADDLDLFDLSGHLKYQLIHSDSPSESFFPGSLPGSTRTDHSLDLRLKRDVTGTRFSYSVHGEALAIGGDTKRSVLPTTSSSSVLIGDRQLLNDDRRLINLTAEASTEEQFQMVLRLDRSWLDYHTDRFIVRAGRQAVSWGNGLAFQVLDLFNPFSPTEIDKDYKTGDDMLYSQILFGQETDVEALVVGRRNPISESIAAEEGSYTIKLNTQIDGIAVNSEFLLSRHYDENIVGAGINRDFLGGVIRFDFSLVELHEGGWTGSFLANADRSWTVFGKNLYTFVEYFYSGLGVSKDNYQAIDEALSSRLFRGELYSLGRNYLTVGAQIELTPLLILYPSQLLNLNDESGFTQLRLVYEVMTNLQWETGTNLPFGPTGSEFGGIEIIPETVIRAPLQFYTKLSWFF